MPSELLNSFLQLTRYKSTESKKNVRMPHGKVDNNHTPVPPAINFSVLQNVYRKRGCCSVTDEITLHILFAKYQMTYRKFLSLHKNHRKQVIHYNFTYIEH